MNGLAQSDTNSPPGHRLDRILVKPKLACPQALENLHAQLGNRVTRRFPRIGNWQVVQLPTNAAVAPMVARQANHAWFWRKQRLRSGDVNEVLFPEF